MGCFLVWLRGWLVLWEESRQEIVLNLSLPFQSVCMFLFIILQFLSTYAIIKFPDPCLAALTRHLEIYSHCRSLTLMCSHPPASFPFQKLSLSLSLPAPLSFTQFLWHCNEIRIINRVIVWNTLVCIEILTLIFDAWLSGYWADAAASLYLSHLPTTLQTHAHTRLGLTSLNGIISRSFCVVCITADDWCVRSQWCGEREPL